MPEIALEWSYYTMRVLKILSTPTNRASGNRGLERKLNKTMVAIRGKDNEITTGAVVRGAARNGETVTVETRDENGMPVRVDGVVIHVLEVPSVSGVALTPYAAALADGQAQFPDGHNARICLNLRRREITVRGTTLERGQVAEDEAHLWECDIEIFAHLDRPSGFLLAAVLSSSVVQSMANWLCDAWHDGTYVDSDAHRLGAEVDHAAERAARDAADIHSLD